MFEKTAAATKVKQSFGRHRYTQPQLLSLCLRWRFRLTHICTKGSLRCPQGLNYNLRDVSIASPHPPPSAPGAPHATCARATESPPPCTPHPMEWLWTAFWTPPATPVSSSQFNSVVDLEKGLLFLPAAITLERLVDGWNTTNSYVSMWSICTYKFTYIPCFVCMDIIYDHVSCEYSVMWLLHYRDEHAGWFSKS